MVASIRRETSPVAGGLTGALGLSSSQNAGLPNPWGWPALRVSLLDGGSAPRATHGTNGSSPTLPREER